MYSNEKPCEEAVMIELPNWQTRTCSEEEYNERFSKNEGWLWREKGTNHQTTEEGYIKRMDGMRDCWVIDVGSIDKLVELSKKYGELIIDGDEMEIEIYDGYRE